MLSKHWGYQQTWPQLQALLFWQGDTSDLFKDDTTILGSSGSDKFPIRE
jgi:hypothetical protein